MTLVSALECVSITEGGPSGYTEEGWIARVGVIAVVAVARRGWSLPGVRRRRSLGPRLQRRHHHGRRVSGSPSNFEPGGTIGAKPRASSASTTTTRSRASRSSTRSSPTTSRTRRPRSARRGASSPRSACSRSCRDLSEYNPGQYLNQQHVPYFGWAFDDTYCSAQADHRLCGFGFNGCLVPSDPTKMPGTGAASSTST